MLQKLHDRSGSLVIKIILTVIGASFVVFGIADVVRIITATPPVAKIGRHPISFQDFFQIYQQQLRLIKHKEGVDIDAKILEELSDNVVNSMINKALLNIEPERLGVIVPQSAVSRYVTSIPLFHKNGEFNVDLYQRYLGNRGAEQRAFLSGIKSGIERAQFMEPLVSNVKLNTYYSNLLLDTYRERKVFEVVFAPDHFDIEKPSDADLKAYLKSNAKKYTVPEQRDVEFYCLDYGKLKETFSVTQEEISNEFEERKEEWMSSEQRMVYSFSCFNQTDAELVKRLLLKHTKFEKIRKKIPGIQLNTIGMVNKGALPQEISDSVFALNAGESFGPVRSGDDYLVYAVTEVRPASSKSMEDPEVKKALEDGIRDKKLSSKLEEYKNLIEDDFAAGKTDHICQKFQILTKKSIEGVSQNNYQEELKKVGVEESSYAAMQDVIFSLDENGDSQFIDMPNASVVVRVTKIKKENVPELEAIKEKVSKDWTESKMEKTASEWCYQHFCSVADNDKNWNNAIRKYKSKTEEFSISQMDLVDEDLDKHHKIFHVSLLSKMMLLPKKMADLYKTKDGKIAVVRVKKIENILNCKADKAILENDIKENIIEGVKNDLSNLLPVSLKNCYKVKINKKSLDKIQKRFSEDN